jgi:hypothetical protein
MPETLQITAGNFLLDLAANEAFGNFSSTFSQGE